MNFSIVIPAHNEAVFIGQTIQSLIDQSLQPKKLIIVDDQSTDETAGIIEKFSEKHAFVSLIKTISSTEHLPGSKVVNAFFEGYSSLEGDFDIICKFDADLIFPKNYLETISRHFEADPKVGMAGGFCHIENNGQWILENLTGKDHIRGALKAYRKECFRDIGGLKPSMGWDTVDELLAQFHGWKVFTDPSLQVKHLRPTGFTYNKSAKFKQGAAFYKLRYGLPITLIASGKLAFKKKSPALLKDYIQGYLKAKKEKQPFLVSEEEGRFIRKLRWKKMRSKLL